jgi:hypothetical protein
VHVPAGEISFYVDTLKNGDGKIQVTSSLTRVLVTDSKLSDCRARLQKSRMGPGQNYRNIRQRYIYIPMVCLI